MRFTAYNAANRIDKMRSRIPTPEDCSNVLLATVLDPVKSYRVKNHDFQGALIWYFEDAKCTVFEVRRITVTAFRTAKQDEAGETYGLVTFAFNEELDEFASPSWNDDVDGVEVLFEKIGLDQAERTFLPIRKRGPRADDDDAESERN